MPVGWGGVGVFTPHTIKKVSNTVFNQEKVKNISIVKNVVTKLIRKDLRSLSVGAEEMGQRLRGMTFSENLASKPTK